MGSDCISSGSLLIFLLKKNNIKLYSENIPALLHVHGIKVP